MKPDEQGRFGFNVKGGHDQNCPVLVSRILPNTPADCAEPKLHEGDQVLAINSVEVSGLKHEQVVQLIRSTKDLGPDAKLLLSIRPNVYYKHCQCPNETIDTVDHEQCNPEQQSPFHYTPLNYSVSPSSFIDDINPEESGDDDDDDRQVAGTFDGDVVLDDDEPVSSFKIKLSLIRLINEENL